MSDQWSTNLRPRTICDPGTGLSHWSIGLVQTNSRLNGSEPSGALLRLKVCLARRSRIVNEEKLPGKLARSNNYDSLELYMCFEIGNFEQINDVEI